MTEAERKAVEWLRGWTRPGAIIACEHAPAFAATLIGMLERPALPAPVDPKP